MLESRLMLVSALTRRYVYAATISLALVVLLFSVFDMQYELSYRIWWWDSLEHALGGVCIGFFALTGIEILKIRRHRLAWVLCGVLVAGLAWELMEYLTGLTDSPFMSYPMDSLKDVILDLMGGYLAARIGHAMHMMYL